jgi:hypothetical protein
LLQKAKYCQNSWEGAIFFSLAKFSNNCGFNGYEEGVNIVEEYDI